MDIRSAYVARHPTLEEIASELKSYLNDALEGEQRIDMIATRAKDIAGFVKKANNPKKNYQNPINEIQDQVGARIVVHLQSDVDHIAHKMKSEFTFIEVQEKKQSDPKAFDYQARHMICHLPPQIINKHNSLISLFELQICTLFQHAWAEVSHDLAYKPNHEIPEEITRKIALIAAQAWGADLMFQTIWNELEQPGPTQGIEDKVENTDNKHSSSSPS